MFNIICKTMTQGPIPDIVDNFGIIEHLIFFFFFKNPQKKPQQFITVSNFIYTEREKCFI